MQQTAGNGQLHETCALNAAACSLLLVHTPTGGIAHIGSIWIAVVAQGVVQGPHCVAVCRGTHSAFEVRVHFATLIAKVVDVASPSRSAGTDALMVRLREGNTGQEIPAPVGQEIQVVQIETNRADANLVQAEFKVDDL